MTGPAAERERAPAIAGTFYPAEPGALARQVEALFEGLAPPVGFAPPGPAPLGLLVPHAGLSYSGRVAAHAWATLAADPPDTLVILGTNHFAGWVQGVAAWTGGPWRTPLGRVEVDRALAERIVGLGPPFAADDAAHRDEHSIEVQLPLLARACPAARIVPLLVTCRGPAACREAGERLGRFLAGRRAAGERLVLVASSDLAHYPADAAAREVDRRMLEPILALDPWELARREARARGEGIPGLVCGLCGLDPVLAALGAAAAMGATRGELLAEATSADVPGGDPRRVVGYAAVAFVA